MPTPLAFTLPAPCPVDGKPVVYSGKGRRPVVCSTACRVEYRRRAEADRRADARQAAHDEATRLVPHREIVDYDEYRRRLAGADPYAAVLGEGYTPEALAAWLADYARRRAAAAEARAREAAAFCDREDALASFDDYVASSSDDEDGPSDPPAIVELFAQPDGSLRWSDQGAAARAGDPAAAWLATHHPHELATFPASVA